MYDRILLPTDGSEGAREATERAIELAVAFDAALHVLHVVDATDAPDNIDENVVLDALEAEGRRALEDVRERAIRADVETIEGTVASGSPYRAILDYVEEDDIDLVVMGTHGRTGLERWVLGSVTERVVRLSPVPVLTVRNEN